MDEGIAVNSAEERRGEYSEDTETGEQPGRTRERESIIMVCLSL